jgi:hypothetical protein
MPGLAARVRAVLPDAVTPWADRAYAAGVTRATSGRDAARSWYRLRRPRTFNEKILHRMAFDRRPLLVTFADRVAARDYVADIVGPDLLTTVYTIEDDPQRIRWEALPREYACKVTHASNAAVFVTDAADPESRLPSDVRGLGWMRLVVRPEHASPDRIAAVMAHWLSMTYSQSEWAYTQVPRRVVVEEFLSPADGQPVTDLKFYVMNGRCRALQMLRWQAAGAQSAASLDFFSPTGERLPMSFLTPTSDLPFPVPELLPRMRAIAESLGAGIDMVRVDLYCVDGRIVFGEFTNYPNAGMNRFRPSSVDEEWGSYWTLDRWSPSRR